MKFSFKTFDQSGDESQHSRELTHFLEESADEETLEDDVNYGIADCRKRLRSQRSTLRAQHHPPKEGSSGVRSPTAGSVGSYAEVLANSMNQSSLSRLVECLLEPASASTHSDEESIEPEEAVIT